MTFGSSHPGEKQRDIKSPTTDKNCEHKEEQIPIGLRSDPCQQLPANPPVEIDLDHVA